MFQLKICSEMLEYIQIYIGLLYINICISNRDVYALEAGGAAASSALFHMGEELPSILNSFHLSLHMKGHFPEL